MSEPGAEAATLDAFLRGRMRLWQPARGARVSGDPLFLAGFARAGGRARRVLDLGAGTGVVGIAIALAEPRAQVVGVELEPGMAALARRNVIENGVEGRVEIVGGDVARPRELGLATGSFDVVVANPPYKAEGRGRRPAGEARARARQEQGATLADFVAAAVRFAGGRGRAAFVLPAERLAEVMILLAPRMPVRRVRCVHSVAGEPARRVLVEGARGYRGGPVVEASLIVHEADRRTFTRDAARLLGGE